MLASSQLLVWQPVVSKFIEHILKNNNLNVFRYILLYFLFFSFNGMVYPVQKFAIFAMSLEVVQCYQKTFRPGGINFQYGRLPLSPSISTGQHKEYVYLSGLLRGLLTSKLLEVPRFPNFFHTTQHNRVIIMIFIKMLHDRQSEKLDKNDTKESKCII